MSDLLPHMPKAPDWRVDWVALNESFPWLRDLAGCPQDPRHHAEGDVWIHVRMVCEALAALPAWRGLPDDERTVLFAAALLHDAAKPECTRVEDDGRITSHHHSRRGAIRARRRLWERGWPFALREQVTALVRWHQVPYHLLERDDAERRAIELSQTARCDHLALLAEADVRGRLCADQQRLLDNVALFMEFCREAGCLTTPRPFSSDHARFLFFRDARRHADAPAHEAFRTEVVLMSGLPGAGKNHWISRNLSDWPVVSLDGLREEMEVDPDETQGAVIQQGRELARDHLRHGRSFVWNATNVSRQLRGEVIRLFADYGARVRIVYIEVPAERLFAQNRQRSRIVPAAVIERLLARWEVPDRTEAHEVTWVTCEP
jgi:predicted kinase